MDYHKFLSDLANWMDQSNEQVKAIGFTNQSYWDWLVSSLGELCDKYDNHPLCTEIVSVMIKFQEDTFKKVSP